MRSGSRRRAVGDVGGDRFEVAIGGPRHGDCRISPRVFSGLVLPLLNPLPVSALLARIEAAGTDQAREAALRLRTALGPAGTLGILDAGVPGWGGRELRAFDRRRSAGRRALAVARRAPCLARVLAAGAIPPRARSPEAVLAGLHAPGKLEPGHGAALLGAGWTFEGAEVVRALLDLPRDWIPAEAAERAAFARVAGAAAPLTALLGGHRCLRGSGGRWGDYEAALAARTPGGDAGSAVRDALDMARAFAEQVAAPLLARQGLSRHWTRPYRPEPAVEAAAARVLFGDKGLPAILSESGAWHARRGEVEVGIGAVGTGRPLSWPVPFDPLRTPSGAEIVPLGNGEDLRREGGPPEAGGLGHCVGGYGRACAEGRAVILSVRADGRRLSTIELDLSARSPRIVQHKGVANGPPPPRSEAAAAWLLGTLASGGVRISPAWRDPAWRRRARTRLDDVCGWPWRDDAAGRAVVAAWSPFLRRPLREIDVLLECLATAAASVAAAGGVWRGPLPRTRGTTRLGAVAWAPIDLAARMSSGTDRDGPPGPLRMAAALSPFLGIAVSCGPGPATGATLIAAWAAAGWGILRSWEGAGPRAPG